MRQSPARRIRSRSYTAIFLFLVFSVTPVAASTPIEDPFRDPCSADEFKQFQFWAGHWDVTQGGEPAGVNHIEIIDGGCAMLERWTSARADFTGHSLNHFDRRSGTWKQHWVDSGGTVLELEGGLRETGEAAADERVMSMVLEGDTPGPDGEPRLNRITWTPHRDGTVRQHWEVRGEEGWTTVFDGLYTRRATAP